MAFRLTDANREIDELIAERDALRAELAKVTDDRDAAMVALEIRTESLAKVEAERDAYKADSDREWGASATERHNLKAALAKVEAERDARVARDHVQGQLEDPTMRDAFCREWAKESLEDAKATARALAMEEIAAWHMAASKRCREAAVGSTHCVAWHERAAGHESDAAQIRELAALPPTLKAVPVEVLEMARDAIEQLAFGLDPDDFTRPQDRYAAQLKISEDALKALFPDWTGPELEGKRET